MIIYTRHALMSSRVMIVCSRGSNNLLLTIDLTVLRLVSRVNYNLLEDYNF